VAAARGVASKRLSSELPPRWKTLFSDVLTQTDEIDGKATKPEKPDQPDREAQQSELAATEPGFDFKVEKQTISLNWKNLSEVTLNYYLMDPEFSFSSNPFVSQDAGRFSIIKPNKTATQALPKDATKLDVPLPGEFAKANLLVEVIGAGKRQTQAYHANTLKLTLTENYGRLETRDLTTDKPLPKAYVKVYAKLNNGTVRLRQPECAGKRHPTASRHRHARQRPRLPDAEACRAEQRLQARRAGAQRHPRRHREGSRSAGTVKAPSVNVIIIGCSLRQCAHRKRRSGLSRCLVS
jgi:hypothetical protein